jgi:hypothetical protein
MLAEDEDGTLADLEDVAITATATQPCETQTLI